MKPRIYILKLLGLFLLLPFILKAQQSAKISFDFYGDTIQFACTDMANVRFDDTLSARAINAFYEKISATNYAPAVEALQHYKQTHKPDDWVYYQLVRKTAQVMSPKAKNYYRYTLYKWFLLCKTNYNATLNIIGDRLLFYVQSDDDIYDIPSFKRDGKRYLCLNYHDYSYNIDFDHNTLRNVAIAVPGATNSFSYRVTQLPDFRPESYYEKELEFNYHDVPYHFKVKMNEDVKKMFTNYPVADYQLYFNAPLSKETYNTLIPQLKDNIKYMSVKHGIDYLMHFTRYAFMYETDKDNFGREKHLSPEQTLLYDHSDCEDRAALFYCLVKEIYNLPMIVLAFPHHLTIAVQFDKPSGTPIIYHGHAYTVCEPTPQTEDLPVGGISADLVKSPYEIAFSYEPAKH